MKDWSCLYSLDERGLAAAASAIMRTMTPRISTLALWRSLRRVLALLGFVALIAAITGAAIIVQASRTSGVQEGDAAIVMVDDEAGTAARLDRARQLYRDNQISRILLLGDDLGASRELLQSRGVKEEAVVEVSEQDQIVQLRTAGRLLADEHLHNAQLIAEPVEMLRLLKIAQDADIRLQSTPISADSSISFSDVVREVGRYFRYVFVNR